MTESAKGTSSVRRFLTAPFAAVGVVRRSVDLRRLLWAGLARDVGRSVSLIALTVVAFDAGGAGLLGLALAIRFLVAGLGAPVLAVVGEGRRPVDILLAGLATGGLGATVAALGAIGDGNAAVVIGGSLMIAVAEMMVRSSVATASPVLAGGPKELTSFNALTSTATAVAFFVGPAIAGLTLLLTDAWLPFGIVAVGYALSALSTIRLRGQAEGATTTKDPRGLLTMLREQRQTLTTPVVAVPFLLAFTQTMMSGGLGVLIAPLAIDQLGIGDPGIGLLRTGIGVGGLLGAFALFSLAGANRLGLLSAVGLVAWGAPLVGLALIGGQAPALVLFGVVGAGDALFSVAVITLLQRVVPDSLRGRVFTLVEAVAVSGVGIGSALAPAALNLFGLEGAFAAFGVTGVVVALACVPLLRKLDRRLPAPMAGVQLLRRTPTFGLLPTPLMDLLALRLRPQSVAAGEVVMVQGEEGTSYMLIEEGRMRVSVDGVDVAVMTPPDGFGEIALLGDTVRTATVTADTDSRLQILDRRMFRLALGYEAGLALDAVAASRLARAAPGRPRPATPVAPPAARHNGWAPPSSAPARPPRPPWPPPDPSTAAGNSPPQPRNRLRSTRERGGAEVDSA